jgi:predicted porin
MKKLLIATAAMAVVAGAQAQSSVTVYGIMDVNYNSTDTKTVGAATAQGESALATSRLGFKGVEDLGGGLKAEFQLESKLTPSSSAAANQTFGREQWVGLSSATLGSVRMGITDVTSAQAFDSSVSQLGDLGNTAGDVGADKAKTVRYTTPTISGFTAEVGYSNGKATTDATTDATSATEAKGTITSASLKYEVGALGLYAGTTSAKITATYDQKDTFYGAKYDFGFMSVGAGQRVVKGVDATEQSTNGDLKSTMFSVAAPVPMLGSGVKAHLGYIKANSEIADRTDTTASATAIGVADNKKTTYALTKAFSKRTTGYVAYIDTNYDSASVKDTKASVVGINHTF